MNFDEMVTVLEKAFQLELKIVDDAGEAETDDFHMVSV